MSLSKRLAALEASKPNTVNSGWCEAARAIGGQYIEFAIGKRVTCPTASQERQFEALTGSTFAEIDQSISDINERYQ
jgi:hypothetical protein